MQSPLARAPPVWGRAAQRCRPAAAPLTGPGCRLWRARPRRLSNQVVICARRVMLRMTVTANAHYTLLLHVSTPCTVCFLHTHTAHTESWSFPSRSTTNLHSAATVPGVLDDSTAGISPTTSGFNMYKTASNMSNDDLAVGHDTHIAATLSGASGGSGPLARRRERFIVVQLDGSFATSATGRVLEDLMDAMLEIGNSGQRVGLGVLSMLGFDDTRDLLVEAEVPMAKVDFIVCNAGADVWFNFGSAGGEECTWEADTSYEQHIAFRWDRNAIARTLNKWASTPSPKLPIKVRMQDNHPLKRGAARVCPFVIDACYSHLKFSTMVNT